MDVGRGMGTQPKQSDCEIARVGLSVRGGGRPFEMEGARLTA